MDQNEDPFTAEPSEEANEVDFDNAFEEEAAEDDVAEAEFDEDEQEDVMANGGESFDAFNDDEEFVEDAAVVDQAEEAIPMESAALAEFEKQFTAKVAEKDEENKSKREAMKQEALEELEKFNQEFKAKCETKHASNKSEEEEFTAKVRDAETNASLNPWERIVTLVDLADKGEGRDVTRLKNMLIQLKNSKN